MPIGDICINLLQMQNNVFLVCVLEVNHIFNLETGEINGRRFIRWSTVQAALEEGKEGKD